MVVERFVDPGETNDQDKNNPGFCGVDAETMMLRNYAQQGFRLVSVITEHAHNDKLRRVFYLTKDSG